MQAERPGAIAEATAALARGELVAFPTDTVYGLASGHDHVPKLFTAKDRPRGKRIPVLLADITNLDASAIVTPLGRRLAQRFWPGPLTIVLTAPRRGNIAFRVPDHDVARQLLAAAGGGLPATSANRSGGPECRTAAEVLEQLAGRIGLVLDGGRTPSGVVSTVVDCTGDEPVVLREGAIRREALEAALAR